MSIEQYVKQQSQPHDLLVLMESKKYGVGVTHELFTRLQPVFEEIKKGIYDKIVK
jgi:hypothetical protein